MKVSYKGTKRDLTNLRGTPLPFINICTENNQGVLDHILTDQPCLLMEGWVGFRCRGHKHFSKSCLFAAFFLSEKTGLIHVLRYFDAKSSNEK